MNTEPAKVTSVALGARLEQEVEIFSEVGPFNGNKSVLVRRAVEEFLRNFFNQEARMVGALHAYARHDVTITRAAEIAGTSFEEMRERLRQEGILQEGMPEGLVSKEQIEARKKVLGARIGKKRRKST